MRVPSGNQKTNYLRLKSKEQHIDFWIEQSEDDWKAVFTFYNGRNYLQSLFFTHLVIEKLCKSLWIKYNPENVPPRSRNLNLCYQQLQSP